MISVEEFLRNHPVADASAASATGVDGPADTADAYAADDPSGADDPVGADGDGVSEESRTPRRSRSRWGSGTGVADDPADADACREAALRLLDSAARSSGALRDRLLDKGYDGDVVERTLARLDELRLIDDREYAESVVRSCIGRMMGRRGTVMELERKGVDRGLAMDVADEAERDGMFEDAAWELGRSVAHRTRGLDRRVRQRRLWSAGGRKGHDPETLRRVAMELLS